MNRFYLASSRFFALVVAATFGVPATIAGQHRSPRILVPLPLTTASWRPAIAQLAQKSKRCIGLELLGDESGGRPTSDRALDLTDLDLSAALDALIAKDSRYAWRESSSGCLQIRPKAAFDNRANFLNASLTRFDLNQVDIRTAIMEVHRHFDPAHPARSPAGDSGLTPISRRDPIRGAFLQTQLHKPISVHVERTTIARVLDEIARTHGGVWWSISYRGAATYERATIRMNGFENWTVGIDARGSRSARER